MMVQLWRKLLPDIEEYDFQGFPTKEITMSEILDTVCAMRSSENVNELQSDACDLSFQHMTDMDIVDAAAKQMGEEEGGEYESKKEKSREYVNHSMLPQ
jgi:hypothetical protein